MDKITYDRLPELTELIMNADSLDSLINKLTQEFNDSPATPIKYLISICINAIKNEYSNQIDISNMNYNPNLISITDLKSSFKQIRNTSQSMLESKYSKYVYGSELQHLDPMPVINDKLTSFDVSNIIKLVLWNYFNAAVRVRNLLEKVPSQINSSEKLKPFIESNIIDMKYYCTLSDSEKAYVKEIKTLNAFLKYGSSYIDNIIDPKNIKDTRLSLIFQLILESNLSSDTYNLQTILKIMQYLLVLSVYSLKMSSDPLYELSHIDEIRSILVYSELYRYLLNIYHTIFESSHESYDSETSINKYMAEEIAILNQLDISNKYLQDFINDELTSIYTNIPELRVQLHYIFKTDINIGERYPDVESLMNNFLYVNFINTQSIKSVLDVIENVKTRRTSDPTEYKELVQNELFSGQLLMTRMNNWVSTQNKLIDTYSEKIKEFNTNAKFSVFIDESPYGVLTALMSSDMLNVSMRRMLEYNISRHLKMCLINAHIKDDVTIDWNTNTIGLLIMYTTALSYQFSLKILHQFNYEYSILKFGNVLNYRNARLPQFQYKKENRTEQDITDFSSFDSVIKKDHAELIRRCKDNIPSMVKTDKDIQEACVKYIADAILNNTISAEYAIHHLLEFHTENINNDNGTECNIFTNTIRYILARVGEKTGEFYKKFEKPEILSILQLFGDTKSLNKFGDIKELESNLEFYVFTAILQRIIFNIEFGTLSNSIFKDSCVKTGLFTYRCSINDNSKIGQMHTINFSENQIFKDIKNAMNIFDTTFERTAKNDNWFEDNKNLIVNFTGGNHV